MRAPRLLALGGPTASGKTAAALELARATGGQILCADAMTVYRGLDIGTAKPDRAMRAEVPHHGLDLCELDQEFNIADFLAEVDRAMAAAERLIIVGGTPFWLQALVQPLPPLPPPDPGLRAELGRDPEALYPRLCALDPAGAAALHPRDQVRVLRALEICLLSGRPASELKAGPRAPGRLSPEQCLWLDPEELRPRIGQRLRQMLDQGYLDEVRALSAAGRDPGLKPLRSFSYAHLLRWAAGVLELEEALRQTEAGTWHMARKQRTWGRSLGWAPWSMERGRALLGEGTR
jgi:tRNA dimethylallyltransferase